MTAYRDLPVYLTDPQIDLILIAIDRLEIEMSEPGTAMAQFTGSQVAALGRAKSSLLAAQSQRPMRGRR